MKDERKVILSMESNFLFGPALELLSSFVEGEKNEILLMR